MDAELLRGYIWTDLSARGVRVVGALHLDNPELRALIVHLDDGRQLLVAVGELREPRKGNEDVGVSERGSDG